MYVCELTWSSSSKRDPRGRSLSCTETFPDLSETMAVGGTSNRGGNVRLGCTRIMATHKLFRATLLLSANDS